MRYNRNRTLTAAVCTFTIQAMSKDKKQIGAADNQAMKPLTRKQKVFVQYLMDNPKASATAAALQAYGKPGQELTRRTAEVIASENMRKPEIVSAMASFNDLAESTIKQVMTDWGKADKPRQRELALDAAKYTHDKIHGKATQRVEQHTTGVTLTIDLAGSLAKEPAEQIPAE